MFAANGGWICLLGGLCRGGRARQAYLLKGRVCVCVCVCVGSVGRECWVGGWRCSLGVLAGINGGGGLLEGLGGGACWECCVGVLAGTAF